MCDNGTYIAADTYCTADLLWHWGTQIMVGCWQKNTKYIYYLKPLKQMWHLPWSTVRSHNSAGDTKCRVGHKWNEGFVIYWGSHDIWIGQQCQSLNWHLSPSILLQSTVQRMPAFELWTVYVHCPLSPVKTHIHILYIYVLDEGHVVKSLSTGYYSVRPHSSIQPACNQVEREREDHRMESPLTDHKTL